MIVFIAQKMSKVSKATVKPAPIVIDESKVNNTNSKLKYVSDTDLDDDGNDADDEGKRDLFQNNTFLFLSDLKIFFYLLTSFRR